MATLDDFELPLWMGDFYRFINGKTFSSDDLYDFLHDLYGANATINPHVSGFVMALLKHRKLSRFLYEKRSERKSNRQRKIDVFTFTEAAKEAFE